MHFSLFMLENTWYHNFTWSWPNSQEIVNFVPIYFGFPGTHNWNIIHNFLWIRSTSGKLMISYVSSMKMEDYMEIVFWHFSRKISPCTQGSDAKLSLQSGISFRRNLQMFWTRLLTVEPYYILIYVKEKSFCLINRVFPFVGPREPISCSNVAKIFHAY